MASGTKSGGVFTGNPMGDSPSAGIKTSKVGHGQAIKSAYPQDNVHGYDMPNTTGGKMGGGDTYLGHSLKGAAAVQEPNVGNRDGV
jgi:hypothetical protein